MPEHKVFCLGFQKTGTSSLGLALKELGYSVAGYNPFRPFATRAGIDIETLWQTARPIAESMDAAQDTPWPILYPYLKGVGSSKERAYKKILVVAYQLNLSGFRAVGYSMHPFVLPSEPVHGIIFFPWLRRRS